MRIIRLSIVLIFCFVMSVLTACDNTAVMDPAEEPTSAETTAITDSETTDPVTEPQTETVTYSPEPTVAPVDVTAETLDFSELPDGFMFYEGLMSSPRAELKIADDGSFTVHWERLIGTPSIDPETGEDLDQKTITGTLTTLNKTSDYIYQCEVASCDTDDYTVGETLTVMLKGAPSDQLPDKRYPEVLGYRYTDGKLDDCHLYFENEDAIFVA